MISLENRSESTLTGLCGVILIGDQYFQVCHAALAPGQAVLSSFHLVFHPSGQILTIYKALLYTHVLIISISTL